MKRLSFVALATILILSAPLSFAKDRKSAEGQGQYTKTAFIAGVEAAVGHKLDDAEKGVANMTWKYYNLKWKDEWTGERFQYAIEKGAKNCSNKAMLGSAKAGNAGKKGLKSLVEDTEPTKQKTSDWIKNHTDTSARDSVEE